MSDDDRSDDERNDAPEPEPRLFTLTEAERTRKEIEPLLLDAMECRRKMEPLGQNLSAVAARIMMMGGILVPHERLAKVRIEHDHLADNLRASVARIQATGCVIKDLDAGLLDFPAIIDNEEVFLCWRLGEDRIRFYHSQNEGFSGRKPLNPRDTGPANPIQ